MEPAMIQMRRLPVQPKISDFGFEMQDSSDLEISSARIPQTRRNPIDSCGQSIIELRRVLSASLATQKVDLDKAHGIHVWIAQSNRSRQHEIVFQKLGLIGDAKN